jgi:hypothetical protein
VGADNDDNCSTALAVIGSVRKGIPGTPTKLDGGIPRLLEQHGAALHHACKVLGLSMATKGWYMTVANV